MISRASTQQYQSEPGNLAEIAKQLGVANILEGSVQKAGNQVRVNVHLVNVQTGSQLYSPAPITPALLRLDPLWDPLRGDPVFQKLCEEKQP